MHILLGKFIIIFLNIISNSLFIYLRKNNLRMKDKIYELTLNQIDALEPFLKEYYGYTEELLLLDIIDTYMREVENPKLFAMTKRLENENIGDNLKRMKEKSKEEEEDSRSMNEIVRSENYNLKLNFGEFSFEELKKKCVLPEHEYNDVWYAVLFIVTYLISVSDRLTPSINFQYAFLSLPAKRILWYIGH